MPKPTDLVELACGAARARGVAVVRGPVFDWGTEWRELPVACNVMGAVLLAVGRQGMVRNGFQEGWREVVLIHLGVTWPWLWRFLHGWDRGNLLVVSFQKDGKECEERDETSRLGDRLARQLCGPAAAQGRQVGVDQA